MGRSVNPSPCFSRALPGRTGAAGRAGTAGRTGIAGRTGAAGVFGGAADVLEVGPPVVGTP